MEVFDMTATLEAHAAIDELYAEVCDGLNSIGCGYFWGYSDCYRGTR